MIELVVVLIVVGILVWGISQITMIPQPFKIAIWCVIAIGMVLYLASFFGHPVLHFPR